MKKPLFTIIAASLLSLGIASSIGGPIHAAAPSTIKMYSQPPFDFYKISQGDTLYFIGKRYGVSTEKLIQINQRINPYNLQAGQIIKLKNPTTPTKPTTPSAPSKESQVPSPASNIGSYAQQVAELVNKERAKAGLSPLRVDAKLSNMAKDKAIDIYTKNYFAHNSPTYGSPFDMMKSYNISYNYAGENIAKGQKSAQEVMTAWMNSSGHRANILNSNYTTIGVAYYNGVWVQEFTG